MRFGSGREITTPSSVSASSFTSCVFAPERTTAKGSPFSSVRIERFVPIFSTVCRVLPHRLPRQRRFYHAAVHTLPFPADSFHFIIFFQSFCPNLFKESRCRPLLEILMYTAARPIFFGNRFPLTTGSQNIEYPFQHLPFRQRLPPPSGLSLILFFGIPAPIWDFIFDCLPEGF